ncbi:MAG: hypothetical protein APU95_04795 [Hadesarchaea archaeon YNP_N21]|jgi:hypothetical protein|nr:MAG: hypothetical protein APU95_04795 [Hadesarchaea archaeon YNP_N21]
MPYRLKESWGAYFGAGALIGFLFGQIISVYLPWGQQLPSVYGWLIFPIVAIAFFLLGSYEK